MEQPPGHFNPNLPDFVCKLHKSIYGLKQAPRAWFDKLSQFLLHIGFTCSKADSSLFVFHLDHITILMLIYVDDIILTGNDDQFLHSLIKHLSTEFALKDLGDIHYFLGIEVHRHPNGITLSQGNYIKDLLNRSHMINSAHINTPMALKTPSTLPTANNLIDATSYRSIVGALQYVTYTRPDIVQAVNKVCQKLQNPTASDMTSVKRIL